MTNESFKNHLGSILKVAGIPAFAAQAMAASGRDEVPLGVLLHELTRSGRIEDKINFPLNEDFILGPLPNNMTLYTPHDFIQIAKEFYGARGFTSSKTKLFVPKYDETVAFGDPKRGGFVHFDLGEGFRTDNQYELWVTTNFFDISKRSSGKTLNSFLK